jgi:hypothetical protein
LALIFFANFPSFFLFSATGESLFANIYEDYSGGILLSTIRDEIRSKYATTLAFFASLIKRVVDYICGLDNILATFNLYNSHLVGNKV